MTPAETWIWIDAIGATRVGDDAALQDLRLEHGNALFDELAGGRQMMANITVYGGVLVRQDGTDAHIHGCIFHLADKKTLSVPA